MYNVKVSASKLTIMAPAAKIQAFTLGDGVPSRVLQQSAGGATKGKNTALPRLLWAQLCKPQGGESFKDEKFIQTQKDRAGFLATGIS